MKRYSVRDIQQYATKRGWQVPITRRAIEKRRTDLDDAYLEGAFVVCGQCGGVHVLWPWNRDQWGNPHVKGWIIHADVDRTLCRRCVKRASRQRAKAWRQARERALIMYRANPNMVMGG